MLALSFQLFLPLLCDQQQLHPAVGGEGADGVLDDFELAGFYRDFIKDERPEDNPRDGENAEGRTVREVASELSLSVKTVEAHKLNLMRKLDIHNRASLIEYAAQQGWIAAQPA